MVLDALTRRLLRLGEGDRPAARRAIRAQLDSAKTEEIRRQLRSVERFVAPTDGLVMGSTTLPNGGAAWVRVPWRIAHGLSRWIVGATGGGKTTAMLCWKAQDLRDPKVRSIDLDSKGDYATGLLEVAVPWVATHISPEDGAELLSGLRVIAPWDARLLPSLHLTWTGPAMRERSTALVGLFNATTTSGNALGHNQEACFVPLVRLLMSRSVPFALLADVAVRPGFRNALLAGSDDAELRGYFDTRFENEGRGGVLRGILTRMDRFLADDATRLALFGPEPFDSSRWLEEGTTVASFGGGLDQHRRFWASVTVHALVRAILRRRPTRSSPRVVVGIDEVQRAIPSAEQAQDLEDALSLMRSRKASLSIAHQHPAQLADHPALLQSLRTNVGTTVAFRSPAEGSALSHVFPESLPPGVDASRLSEADIRRVWEQVLPGLPERTFLLRVPDLSPASIIVRAPHFDVDALRREVPEDIRAIARDGQEGFTRDDLAARERAWRQAVHELDGAPTPNLDALGRLVGADPGDTETEVG